MYYKFPERIFVELQSAGNSKLVREKAFQYFITFIAQEALSVQFATAWTSWLWTVHSFEKFQNTIFLRYQKILSRGYWNGSKTTPIFF